LEPFQKFIDTVDSNTLVNAVTMMPALVAFFFVLVKELPPAGVMLSLNGVWHLSNDNGTISIPAIVPGTTHLDLLRAKLISEPYRQYGELEQAWVHLEPEWTYSRVFDATGLVGHSTVLLRSEGLDTIATVKVNKVLIGRTTNMWHRPVWSIKHALLPSPNNTIEVVFESPSRAAVKFKEAYPYDVPGWIITPFQHPYCGNCSDCFLDPGWRARCSFSDIICTQECHWFPRLLASSEHACAL
jgi:hypothetical protein